MLVDSTQNMGEIVAIGKCSHHKLLSGKGQEGVKRVGGRNATWIS